MPFALAIFISLTAAFGCRTTEGQGNFADGEQVPLRLDSDEADEGSVPTFLWSASRRRAMAGYHFMVAESLALEGRYQKAYKFFESSYNLDPNPFLAGKLISARAGTGALDEALPQAKKMVLLYPSSPDLRFLYGQLLARRGVLREAEAQLEMAIDLDPAKTSYYLELTNVHQAAGSLTKAVVIAKALVEAIPTAVQGWSRLAKLYLAGGQKKEALAPARRAYELNARNPEIVLVYALTLELNGSSKTALGLYEQLYRINPTNEELIARMIELYRSIGDLEESLELLNEVSKITGGNKPGVEIQRAIILWELRRFAPAAAILGKLANTYPKKDRLQYMAGLGQEKIQKLAEAENYFRSIPKKSQFYDHAQFRIAVIYKTQERYDDALKVAYKLEQDPDVDWDIYVLIAGIHGDKKEYAKAIALLNKGYKRHSGKHRLLFLRGVYEEKNKDISACIATMRDVIGRDPKNSSAYNYLGYLFAERGENLDEAEQLIRRALELKPGDGYYLDSLAWVFYQRKQYKTALTYLEQALEVVPNEGVVLEHIGDVYDKLGQRGKALKFYQKAMKGKLEEQDRKRVSDKLKSLSVES